MKPEDIIGVLILATWLGMLALEALRPARTYPRVKGWRIVGALSLLLYMTVGTMLPLLLPPWLFAHSLLDLSGLGVAAGVVVGFAAVTFVGYWYHRACHRFDGMWRWFHQLHHSAPRLDIGGSMMFHPLEMAAYTSIQIGVLVLVLGVHPLAAAVTGYVGAFYGMFQHLNVRTPRWLAYVIQRPEAHGQHHEAGVHARNYGDLPLWDLLFGTFSSPPRFEGQVGFAPGTHRRVFSMLVGRDVSGGTGTAAQKQSATATAVAA